MNSAIIYYEFSYSAMPLVKQPMYQGFTISGPLVLRFNSFKFSFTLTEDRDQTVLRRSKLRSCTTLFGEQPNPWNRLQLQDVIMLRSNCILLSQPSDSKPYMNISIHTAPLKRLYFNSTKKVESFLFNDFN